MNCPFFAKRVGLSGSGRVPYRPLPAAVRRDGAMATPSELPCGWWSPRGMGGEGCVWAAGLGRSEALLVGVGGGVGLGCIGRLGRFGVGGDWVH